MSDRIVTIKLPMREAKKLLSLAKNGWDDGWIMAHSHSNQLGLNAMDKLTVAIRQSKSDRAESDPNAMRWCQPCKSYQEQSALAIAQMLSTLAGLAKTYPQFKITFDNFVPFVHIIINRH